MKRSLWIWFVVLAALLVANTVVSQGVMRSLIDDRLAWQQIRELKANLNGLLSDVKDAETGQRGYLLVGQKEYLQPYLDSRQRINDRITAITSLAALSPQQSGEFLQIVTLIGRKQQEMESAIQAYQTSGPAAAGEIVDTGLGRKLMDNLRDLIGKLTTELSGQLSALNLKSASNQTWAFWLSILANATGLLFLGVLYVYTSRTLEQRAALMEAQRVASTKVGQALREKENALREATQANKVKDEFLAIVSHELRTPLNAILGWATLLKDGGTDAEIGEAMLSIERNAKSQSRLIEDLLDVSRVISGKIRLQVAAVDLREIAKNVLESLRPTLETKGLHVTQGLTSGLTEVLGDADRLQQVVWNLLSNAIKFTPKGGRISVAVQQEDSTAILTVRDSGQGIDPAFLPHIFNRFTQADTTSTRGQGGLGLGLAIVRHLVELHGGHVSAASSGPDRGATFRIALPLLAVRDFHSDADPERSPASAPDGVDPNPPLPELTGKKVLVVDDQPDTLRVLTTVLERCGATVQTAGSAQEALKVFEANPPHVIISDIGMPGEDGYSLISKVRTLPAEQEHPTPAMALTAFAKAEDRDRALAAGFNDHLPKPADARELAHRVARLMAMY